jgi:elongator complex protein 4
MSFRRLNTNESLPPPGVKISVHNHQTLTSSGVSSLDELLGGGIPLGRIFLLKQDRFSGYSDVLFKYFISQGIYLDHEIILASLDQNPAQLLKELMKATEKQSDDKEKDEEYIPAVQRSARTMGSLRTVVDRTEKMSIAWRYENQPKFNSGLQSNTSKAYLHTFDLTKRIEPEVLGLAKITIYGAKEVTQDKYNVLLEHIRKKLSLPQFNQGVKCTKNVLRVCVNGVGSPDWNEDEKLVKLFKFLYSLKGMIRNTNGVVYVTIPAYLYNDFHGVSSNPYIRRIEHAVDGVIEIESFQGIVLLM